LVAFAHEGMILSGFVYTLLKGCQVFQFHDTSGAAKIRNKVYIEENKHLLKDAGNLAAFLYALKNRKDGFPFYQRIVNRITSIFPQFGDFELQPSALNKDYIRLNWREKGEPYLFGPHQLSDGTLRFMALATLLLQPKESLPSVVILDEPELGLHPAAISSLAGMVKTAVTNTQVILATQSPRLVDEFEAEDIVIVERDEATQSSVFKRLDKAAFSDWLQRYSLSELWEKNVLGGKP
jgi:predicted ATPase